jgi:ectoine hydroxylase
MKLNKEKIQSYHENGFLILENYFGEQVVNRLKGKAAEHIQVDTPGRILEKDGSVRSVFDLHRNDEEFGKLSTLEKLVLPAMSLLESEVYIHQSKLNCKRALVGDWWKWHQDFPYWHLEDKVPNPQMLTVTVFLDDVTEFNGPMFLIPGSHRNGISKPDFKQTTFVGEESDSNGYQQSAKYMSSLTAELKYVLDRDLLKKWVEEKGIVSAKGKAGTVLIFDGNIFHASGNNLSPFNRDMFLITYNSVNNTPSFNESPRPEFLSSSDYTPIKPIPEWLIVD